MNRGRAVLFIHVFVALQLILPLTYYTVRTDRNDERFAWRMFSVDRATQCEVKFLVGPSKRPVKLSSKFHEAWISTARRGRTGVIEKMAEHLCQAGDLPPSGREVYVDARCQPLKGAPRRIASGDRDVCKGEGL